MEAEYYEQLIAESEQTGKPIWRKTEPPPFDAVPVELKQLRQWVCWRYEERRGKQTKIPYQTTGQKAQSNNPQTWTSFDSVLPVRAKFDGIGFVFSDADALCGIDLDECLSDNKVKPWAMPIVERLKVVSYGEVSPGGDGIKFWTQALLPSEIKHKSYVNPDEKESIEAYDRNRYFTTTGRGKGQIGEGQVVVDWLVSEYLRPDSRETPRAPKTPVSNLSSNDVIAKIQASRQRQKFETLMHGNTTGYGSQSEADCALCSVIAFWTQDASMIDAIFRKSQLMRTKWDEKHRGDGSTYGEMTIERALVGLTETYTPSSRKSRSWVSYAHQINRRRRYRDNF